MMYYKLTKWLIRSRVRGAGRLVQCLALCSATLRNIPVELVSSSGHQYLLWVDLLEADLYGLMMDSAPPEQAERYLMHCIVRPGDVAFDIGAYAGYHVAELAVCVGKEGCVHAFEPNPSLLGNLQRTAAAFGNVEVHPVVVSSESGLAILHVPAQPSKASLSNWTADQTNSVRRLECQQEVLDRLVAAGHVPSPDFIKCDVEGAELDVFRGAIECLSGEHAPIILFEVNPEAARSFGIAPASAMDFLASLPSRFQLFEICADGHLKHCSPANVDHGPNCFWNILAVPENRMKDIPEDLLEGHVVRSSAG